jgi:hypothetical protein
MLGTTLDIVTLGEAMTLFVAETPGPLDGVMRAWASRSVGNRGSATTRWRTSC